MPSQDEKIVAWHFILCTYGFWLPNDPRGSWSRFVRSPHIFAAGGAATGGGNIRRSVAGARHNVALRHAAKAALLYPPVRLDGIQARAVARGLALAVAENNYCVHACAIMPDHVHILMAVQSRRSSHVAAHLKARATQRINIEGVNPLSGYATSAGVAASMWARRHWCVFVHQSELARVRQYIQRNPEMGGLKRQRWNFVASVGCDP